MVSVTLLVLLLFGVLFFTAQSSSVAGTISPDWGVASLRIGLAAAVLVLPALALCVAAWRVRARRLFLHSGLLVLLLAGACAIGLAGGAALHRWQGHWLEGQHQYGLALAAYQLSGASLPGSQDMARITVEWAEQLSTQHSYAEAIPQ